MTLTYVAPGESEASVNLLQSFPNTGDKTGFRLGSAGDIDFFESAKCEILNVVMHLA